KVEIVSGVPSFVAAAGRAKQAITVKGDRFLLCDNFKEELLDQVDSICILKAFRNKEEILDRLERRNFDYRYIKHCTWIDEEVLTSKEEIRKDQNYISLILA